MGAPWLPVVKVAHPLGGIPAQEVIKKADIAANDIIFALTHNPKLEEKEEKKRAEKIVVRGTDYANSVENMNHLFIEHNWGDGLPLVPPTEEAVKEMLGGTSHLPDEVVGIVDPERRMANVQAVAINAVMAGAKPEYMPVILAAVEAIIEPDFHLKGMATTTGACSPMLIVSQPIARQLNINWGHNALGAGWRANATIGRAVSLIIRNLGGVIPGVTDMTTYGGAWEYTCCFAENEDALPTSWEPLRMERGYGGETSTVTVKAISGQLDIFAHKAVTGREILLIAAAGIANCYYLSIALGYGVVIALCPEHAALVAKDGYSKEDVKHFIFENARIPYRKWKELGDYAMQPLSTFPKWITDLPDEHMTQVIPKPEDIMLLVTGGAGKHSVWWPGSQGNAVTKIIDKWK